MPQRWRPVGTKRRFRIGAWKRVLFACSGQAQREIIWHRKNELLCPYIATKAAARHGLDTYSAHPATG